MGVFYIVDNIPGIIRITRLVYSYTPHIYTSMYIYTSISYNLTAGVWVNALREFGAIGNGPIVGDFQNCTNLLDCSATGNDNCGHVNDAGIRCLGKHLLYICGILLTCDALLFTHI